MQHLLYRDDPQHMVGLGVRTGPDRVERGQVGRNCCMFELHGRLQMAAQFVDRGNAIQVHAAFPVAVSGLPSALAMCSAVRKDSAAIVSVVLEVPAVGML